MTALAGLNNYTLVMPKRLKCGPTVNTARGNVFGTITTNTKTATTCYSAKHGEVKEESSFIFFWFTVSSKVSVWHGVVLDIRPQPVSFKLFPPSVSIRQFEKKHTKCYRLLLQLITPVNKYMKI